MKLSNVTESFRRNIDTAAYIFLLNLLLFIPLLLTPVFQMIFTDHIFTERKNDWLLALLTIMTVTACFAGVVNWLQKNCLSNLSNNIESFNQNRYMQILFNSSIRLFTKKDSAALLSKSEKSARISKLLTEDILSLLFDIFRVIFYLIVMFLIDLTMSLIVIALVLINMILSKFSAFLHNKFTSKNNDDPAFSSDDLSAQSERIYARGLQNIETFKSAAAESTLFKRLFGARTAIINAKRDDDFENACSPIERLPEMLFLNLLLMISALRIMERSLSIGTYLEFQAFASAFFYPLSGVLSARGQLKDFEKKLTVFFKDLEIGNDEKTVKVRPANGKRKLKGYIEFKDISFGYEENIPVIKNFSLSITPGQRIAVTGESGTGKTTLLKLLQGLYEPDSGSITIDGIPIAEIDRALFRNSIGCANQEPSFFCASIRENITLWDKNLTEPDVYNSAQDARIHKYISSLDGAYEYKLSENGNNISKGQCQKLEITRALVYNPSIVMFDEATSAIDPESRKHIESILKKRRCTCIAVTHLLEQVTEYDQIIVLGKSKVIARGKHDDLMYSSSYYNVLFESEKLTAPYDG
ncbi:MAG: ATP-binding cassette domain-containing protein [Chitinispirillales bacterium]|jgi:ABC-type bacteriocin/lantibiotic exporter with double-glycine peptidase domain|nr:ATP-binding cassette domain-containing protein [Chitinispirillales bacterium]